MKRVVDESLHSFDQALIDETGAFGALIAAGEHEVRMQRFLDAGGQTRVGEMTRWDALMDAMSDPD